MKDTTEGTIPANDNFNSKFMFLCGGMLLTFVYIFAITFGAVPKENESIAYLILGVLLGSCIKEAYSYLFGSTLGSQSKDVTMKQTTDSLIAHLAASSPAAVDTTAPANTEVTVK